MPEIKVGDKIRFLSDCYRLKEEKIHGEVLEIDTFTHVPDQETKDSYSGKGGTFVFVKVKDLIAKETFWTLAELVEKV